MSEVVATAQQGLAGKYKPYPEYKDSGVEWLGTIPTHWEMWKLAHAYEVIGSGTTPPTNEEGWFGDGIPWVTTGELREIIIEQTSKCITYEALNVFSALRVHPAGSVVIAMYGATIGRLGILGVNATTNQACCVLTRSIHLDNKYVFYWLQAFRDDIIRLSSGGGQPNINQEKVASLKISAPDERHQRTISAFLDYETARIDRLIAQQQRLIELLKEKRQAVISHAVTKGLNPNAPMKDSGIEWLGQVPEHWAVMRLKHLIKSLESGCSVNAADVPAKEDELGVLKTSCVYTRRFRASENKTVVMEDFSRVKCPVRKGAIIISRMNTPELVGASALVDTDASNLFLPDRLWQTIFNDQFEVNPEFLAHFMTVEGFRNQISLSAEGASSSMQNIAKEDYLAINALLPLLEEQIEIVNYIKESEARFLRLEAQAMNAIELMKERRIALISAAVTGKIDLRGWTQPAEEVAA